MVKKTIDILFNVFYYKVALMFFLIPTLLVYCVSFSYKPMFVMMGWGALVCVYDLFVRRNFVKTRGMLWLIGFLGVFALSVLLNFRVDFSLNFSSWAYSVIALFLLYPDCATKDKYIALKELCVINNIFIAMTTIFSTISLGMFVCLYGKRIAFGDQFYPVGWDSNRLFGVYSNTGYMITAIALAVIVIQVFVLKRKNGKVSKPYKAFLLYTAIVDFCSMCMENAKAAFISLAGFVAVLAFFVVFRKMMEKGKKVFPTYFISTLSGILAVTLMFGMIYAIRPVLSYVPGVYHQLGGHYYNEEPQKEGEGKQEDKFDGVDIDRNIHDSYGFFTGRTVIWKFGLEQFKAKPIFGYGPQSHRAYTPVDGNLRHFHNLIVHALVSVGAVGSIFIFTFFITVFVYLLKKLLQKGKTGDENYFVAVAIFALLVMLGINSMAEVTILFIARFAMFLFWMLLGYDLALVNDGEKARGTKLLEVINDKANNILKKK